MVLIGEVFALADVELLAGEDAAAGPVVGGDLLVVQVRAGCRRCKNK